MHREEEEDGVTPSSSGQTEAEEQEVCVVVGTGEQRGHQGGGAWSPCKGRLLMIQIASKQSGTT